MNRDYHSSNNFNSILLVELITEKYFSVLKGIIFFIRWLIEYFTICCYLYNLSKFVKRTQCH